MEPANHSCAYSQSDYGSAPVQYPPHVECAQPYAITYAPVDLYHPVKVHAATTSAYRGQPRPPKSRAMRTISQVEKERHVAHNSAYAKLRRRIPDCPGGLPKFKTLRLAALYINFLSDQLRSPPNADAEADFKRVVAKEVQSRNNYKDRADKLLHNSQLLAETYTHKANMPSSEAPMRSSVPPLPDSTTGSPPQLVAPSYVEPAIHNEQQYYYTTNDNYQYYSNH